MSTSRSYVALAAVSVFAASLTQGQIKEKSQGVGFNAPEMNRGGLSPARNESQVPSEGALQIVDGAITPIPQPTPDYVARTTLFAVTQPDFTIINSLTDAGSGCTVTFSPPVQARTVPGSWLTWGSPPDTESSTPRVLYSQGATSITLTFSACNPNPTTAGFEAEPDPFDTHPMTATFFSGAVSQGSIMRPVVGQAGARLFAADGSFDRIVFTSDAGFAVAQVRFAQGAQAILQGQVTDDTTAAPIQGAQVRAVGGVTRSTSTDAMGNYRLFLPEDTYSVTASAFGYVSQTVDGVTVSLKAPTILNFALAAAPSHRVSGVVTTSDATPVAGALVQILGTPIPGTRTDAKGNYTFAVVPDGTYDIRAGGGGCLSSQTQSVTFTDDVVVNFVLAARSDMFGYTCSDGNPFGWIEGDTPTGLTGDDFTMTVPIGFTFNFYGTDYTTINMSTNGNVHFGPPDASFVSMCLPSPGAIHSLIGPLWDDLIIPPGSHWTALIGDPGSRIRVYEWRDVGFFSGGGTTTMEVILFETTNQITFQYMRTDGRADGRNATIGIQNAAGTDALQYSCHVASVAVGSRVDFFHP